jgi:hypothetical protein
MWEGMGERGQLQEIWCGINMRCDRPRVASKLEAPSTQCTDGISAMLEDSHNPLNLRSGKRPIVNAGLLHSVAQRRWSGTAHRGRRAWKRGVPAPLPGAAWLGWLLLFSRWSFEKDLCPKTAKPCGENTIALGSVRLHNMGPSSSKRNCLQYSRNSRHGVSIEFVREWVNKTGVWVPHGRCEASHSAKLVRRKSFQPACHSTRVALVHSMAGQASSGRSIGCRAATSAQT